MKKVFALGLLAAAAGSASAGVNAFVDVDLAGWQTWGGYGAAANTDTSIALPAGTQIVGADWIGLNFTAINGSWRSEMTLSINDSFNGVGGFWDFAPSADGSPGVYSGSGTFGNPGAINSGPFTMSTSSLYIEVYESFNDGGNTVQDAQIDSGTLRIYYVPVPAPSAAALVGLGGLVAMRRRR